MKNKNVWVLFFCDGFVIVMKPPFLLLVSRPRWQRLQYNSRHLWASSIAAWQRKQERRRHSSLLQAELHKLVSVVTGEMISIDSAAHLVVFFSVEDVKHLFFHMCLINCLEVWWGPHRIQLSHTTITLSFNHLGALSGKSGICGGEEADSSSAAN